MSNVYVIGDLHFGHKNIHKMRKELCLKNEEEHRGFIIAQWVSRIRTRDIVYVLGDIAFNKEGFRSFADLPGRKIAILGNHDTDISIKYWAAVCEEVYGFYSYKFNGTRYWLSHAPIHPDELRGRVNIHGHVHMQTIRKEGGDIDRRYFNASCENIGYCPMRVEEVTRICKEPYS